MKQNKWTLAACTAAALLSTPAFAASTANANLTNFTVTLYSLSQNHNFVPTITFDIPGTVYGTVTAVDNGINFAQNNSFYGSGSISANTAVSHATSTISGVVNNQGLAVSLSSSGSGSGSAGALSSTSYFSTYNYISSASFTLSANTYAVFTATGLATAKTSVGYDTTAQQSEYSHAIAYLQASGGNGFNGTQTSYDQFNVTANYGSVWNPATANYVYSGQDVTQSGALQVSFGNPTANSLTGSLFVETTVDGYSGIAAVPEPETYGMLLAGLGLMAVIAKRRKAKQV